MERELEKDLLISPEFRKEKLGFKPGKINFCFVLPDDFDSFIQSMGLHIVANEVAQKTDSYIDFAFLPQALGTAKDSYREGLTMLFSRALPNAVDIIGLGIPNPMMLFNVFRFFELTGIPAYRKKRTNKHPLVIAGNLGVLNPAPFENFIDALVIGDGDIAIVEIANAYHTCKGKNKEKLLEKLAGIDGVYVPAFTGRKYNKKGELVDVIYHGNPGGMVPFARVEDMNKARRASLLIPPHTSPLVFTDYSCQYKCGFCQMSNSRGAYRRTHPDRIRKYLLEFDEMAIKEVGVVGTCVGRRHELKEIFEWSKKLNNVKPFIFSSLRVEDVRNLSEILPETIYVSPETGNDDLRNNILLKTGKACSIKEEIEHIIKGTHISRLTMLYIVGIPSETDKNHQESIELFNWAARLVAKERERGELHLWLAPLFPQPGTPFEEYGMIGPLTFKKIADTFTNKIKSALSGNIDFDFRPIRKLDHLVEGIANTGDRWTGDFLFDLYHSAMNWNNPKVITDCIKTYNERNYIKDTTDYLHPGNWRVKPWKMIDFGNSPYLDKAKALIRKNIKQRNAAASRDGIGACLA
jgi:radical SAM superfamily enzyme YgiQ (UPF0313 family)